MGLRIPPADLKPDNEVPYDAEDWALYVLVVVLSIMTAACFVIATVKFVRGIPG